MNLEQRIFKIKLYPVVYLILLHLPSILFPSKLYEKM